jgi:hypothetical protein
MDGQVAAAQQFDCSPCPHQPEVPPEGKLRSMEELRPQVIARCPEAAGHQLERDLNSPVLTVCKVQHPFNALIAGILDPASVPVDSEQDLDLARKQTPLRIGGRGGEACLVSGDLQPQRLLIGSATEEGLEALSLCVEVELQPETERQVVSLEARLPCDCGSGEGRTAGACVTKRFSVCHVPARR